MPPRVNLSRRLTTPETIGAQDDAQRALGDIQRAGSPFPLGAATRVLYDDYKARMGELVLLDPSDAALSVTLPDVARADIGRTITVVNASSSANAITVRPSRGEIEGASSNSQSTAWSKVVYVAVAASPAEKWVKIGGTGGGEAWQYLDTTMPSGVGVSPVGLWQFDASGDYLNDRSGEGNDVVVEGADEVFSSAPSILGFMCDGTVSFLYISGAPSSLVISYALTIEIIYCPRKQQVSSGLLVGVGATGGETDETNYQYALYVSGTTSGVGSPTNKNRLNYRHEYGVATAEDWETNAGLEVGEPSLITLTRAANGVGMAIYLNGLLVDTETLSSPPDGGDGSLEFQIGYNCHGTVFSVRITPAEFTAGQVYASYQRVRGLS